MEQEILLIKRGGCWLVPSLISTDCWSLTVSTKHETLKQSSPGLSLFQVLLLLPKSTFNMNVLVFPLYACELIFEIVSSALNHHFSPDCCHYRLQTKYLFISKYPKWESSAHSFSWKLNRITRNNRLGTWHFSKINRFPNCSLYVSSLVTVLSRLVCTLTKLKNE